MSESADKDKQFMLRTNKSNIDEVAVCINQTGAAARCALGLLVVVVLVLSTH